MAFYLEKAIFVNRAPFEHLELDFKEKGINVLTAVNGKGKTTILSHIVDAFYELARPNFENEFVDKSAKYYRVSSPVFNIKMNKPSFVYLRFKKDSEIWDYVDIKNKCTEQEYNSQILLHNKIPYADLVLVLNANDNIKKWSRVAQKEQVVKLFSSNLLTYFPSYRYEEPGFLNDPYSFKIEHKLETGFTGYLPNRIEVFCQFKEIANWLLDVFLDNIQHIQKLNSLSSKLQSFIHVENGSPILDNNPDSAIILQEIFRTSNLSEHTILSNFNQILTNALFAKFPFKSLGISVGERFRGGNRINIVDTNTGETVYPNIFNMSSGEKAIISIFAELLHQMDNLQILLPNLSGVVLIDEIEKNLHVRMQYEVLPRLLAIFPNVQFIATSHSPFFNMGLAEHATVKSQIIDLDNNGVVCEPTNNDLYREVYEMMISENQRYADKYNELKNIVYTINKPVVITEGKTDWKHFKAALEHFKENREYEDLDVEILEYDFDFGDSKLHNLLNQYKTFPHRYMVVGVFDCDEANGRNIWKEGGTKKYGNNVWGMSIDIPEFRSYNTSGISIEFLYRDEDLKRLDENGRRMYVTSEFNENGRLESNHNIGVMNNHDVKNYIMPEKEKVQADGVIDVDGNSLALSKEQFASNILEKREGFASVDFSAFKPVFDRLRALLQSDIN